MKIALPVAVGLASLKGSVGLDLLPLMANGLSYSFLHKHTMTSCVEFVLWTQLVRGKGFWL
jgi:hypothetical protein